MPLADASSSSPFSHESPTPVAFIKQCDTNFRDIYDKDTWTCVPRSSKIGRHIALHRLQKYKNKSIPLPEWKGFIQFKNNCWFNSLLMCLLFSDGSRHIVSKLRKQWIKSNTELLDIFSYVTELPYYETRQSRLITKIDSNMIVRMLHAYNKDWFPNTGGQAGSAVKYSQHLIQDVMGLDGQGYLELRVMMKGKQIYIEVNSEPTDVIDFDLKELHKMVENLLRRHKTSTKIVAIYSDIELHFPDAISSFICDSIYLLNYKSKPGQAQSHAIAGLTLGGKQYVYDGQRAALNWDFKQYDWSAPELTTFHPTYDRDAILAYNFNKGKRIAFYVRKKLEKK